MSVTHLLLYMNLQWINILWGNARACTLKVSTRILRCLHSFQLSKKSIRNFDCTSTTGRLAAPHLTISFSQKDLCRVATSITGQVEGMWCSWINKGICRDDTCKKLGFWAFGLWSSPCLISLAFLFLSINGFTMTSASFVIFSNFFLGILEFSNSRAPGGFRAGKHIDSPPET